MNEVERENFEEKVKNDPKLSSELSLFKDMHNYADGHTQVEASAKKIREVGNEYNPLLKTNKITNSKKNIWKYYLPLAAAAVLLLGIFIRPIFTSSSLDQINYEVSPLSFQVRGAESNEILYLSAEAFNQSDYPLAISHLNELIQANKEVDKARLYKSIALLRTGKHKEARTELELLEPIALFSNASYYYQGLSYLDTEDLSQAKRFFDLVEENSSYFDRAQKRLSQLSKTK